MSGAATHCYSENNFKAQGNVTAIDWVGSVVTVEDTEFFIPSNVEVIKGSDKVGFSDIDVGDSVTVTYSKEKDGLLKAIRIVIAYSGDFPI